MNSKSISNHNPRRYFYIIPLLALVAFIYIYPVVRTFAFSFYDIPFGNAEGTFVGVGNYTNLFQDPIFWTSMQNNFIWAIANTVLQLLLAMVIAAVLNTRFRGQGMARTAVLLPWIIPAAAIACVIRWVLLPNVGIVNEMLMNMNLVSEPINFLGNENAMTTLVLISSWKSVPIGVLLVLSALQSIPKDVYESAQVDGASPVKQFFKITYPIISKMLWFTTFIIFVWNFNAFDLIWMITQGGPGVLTQTLPIMVYRSAFKSMRLGESSAIAMVIAVILIVIGVAYFALMKRGKKKRHE